MENKGIESYNRLVWVSKTAHENLFISVPLSLFLALLFFLFLHFSAVEGIVVLPALSLNLLNVFMSFYFCYATQNIWSSCCTDGESGWNGWIACHPKHSSTENLYICAFKTTYLPLHIYILLFTFFVVDRDKSRHEERVTSPRVLI